MKAALTFFTILLAGVLNISGWAYSFPNTTEFSCDIPAQNQTLENDLFSFHKNHKDNTHIKIAEFEIEEASEKVDRSKQTQPLFLVITASQLAGSCNFHLRLDHIKTRARASLGTAVKPYILYQVFRL